VRDDERPRYHVELATARSDLKQFLLAAGIDVIETGDHHGLFTFTRNPSARAKLIRDLVKAGFDVSSFAESTRAIEDTYFAQVRDKAS
jgi:ABC-2 type transport system ATP-binding protein